MENDLKKEMQDAKSRCEIEILSAIMKFSETTGLQVEDIHYITRHHGEWIEHSVELSTRI